MTAEPTWPQVLTTLIARQDLTREQAAWAMGEIMRGEAPASCQAGFLVALRAKGETAEELTGLADEMLAHAQRFTVPVRSVDIVGTGGDRAHTVNISTMASLVIAGAGLTVVKHGNRAASSSSGSADVLEALGINLDLPPERVAELATEVGITFCFARVFHPSMRFVGPVRGELGVPTVFNFLGPVTNPAQPESTAIGSADARMAGLIAAEDVARRLERGEVTPIEAARRIWRITRIAPAAEPLLRPFVGFASEWEDDPEHRSYYEVEICSAAQRLATRDPRR